MAKSRGTDGSLLSSLPWTLASLLVALLPHIQYLPVWITVIFFACCIWRLSIEKRRAAVPSTWLRAALALFCFLGVLATYETISGVGPGSALLAVMASLKLLETRKRRDQFVLLFIAIFLVMSSLLREQFLWSLPYTLAALVFIMSAWLRMSGDPKESVASSFRTGGRLIAYALPIALVMWFFFPRISSPFWAVPVDTSAGTSGLSDTMSPGDLSSLSMSSEVAFRVRFEGPPPAPRDRYWRAMVLHSFSGRTWSGPGAPVSSARDLDVQVFGNPVRYEITLEATRQQWVPMLEMAREWDLPNAHMGRAFQVGRVYPIDQRISYAAESYPDYVAQPNLNRYSLSWYLGLPNGSNPRTLQLATQLRAKAGSPQALIDAVLTMFNTQAFYYTLKPPALGSNPVDRFLFDTRQGFCEHYASAFAVLMRAAGIPARVVLGYQGGEINSMGEYMIVRQSDAHAWTEVWLEGRGWVRVDPTAAVAPERIEVGFTDSLFSGMGMDWGRAVPSKVLHQLRLSWDALNAGWNDWVLGYGPEKQNDLMRYLGMEKPGWSKMMLALIGLVVALTLLVSLLLMWRYGPPKRDKAALLYEQFVKNTGLELRTGEAPIEFAERVNAQDINDRWLASRVTDAYLATRYGNQPAAMQELERLVRDQRV